MRCPRLKPRCPGSQQHQRQQQPDAADQIGRGRPHRCSGHQRCAQHDGSDRRPLVDDAGQQCPDDRAEVGTEHRQHAGKAAQLGLVGVDASGSPASAVGQRGHGLPPS